MPGKFYNLDTDGNLGGSESSNVIASSQRAVKTYVDGQVDVLDDKIDAIEIVDELRELQDVQLSEAANGQALVYNSTTGKWENKAITTDSAAWGNISGTLSDQTDLNTALSGKAELSHTHTSSEITDLVIPTKTSDLTNDSDFISGTDLSTALEGYVPTTRKVAGKALSGDVTLSASDVGAQKEITSSNKLSADLISESTTKKFVTDTQISEWNAKQTAISDLSEIRSGASAGSTAAQPGANVSIFVNDAGYLSEADIASVFVYQGTKPTVEDLPATGNKKGDVWTVVENGAEYVWDGSTWEYLGQTLDLSGYATKEDLNGYVPTSRKVNNKSLTGNITLNGADVALTGYTKGSTSGSVSASDTINAAFGKIENNLDGKQATISDLSEIRSNASAGKTASNTIAGYGDIVTHNLSEFQEAGSYVTYEEATGSTIQPVYIDSEGKATAISYTVAKSVPSDAKFSDTTYTAGTGLSLSGTTINHKNSVASGSAGTSAASSGSTLTVPYVSYDSEGHITSTGTRTHTVTGFLTEHQDISGKADLSELADVATSGEYSDLKNKPTIPTVNDAKLTIKVNGSEAGSFTANSNTSETINISVPTNNNQLTNGAGYITASSLPSNLSDLKDDLGTSPTHTHSQYLTEHQDISGKQDVIDASHKLSSDLVDDTNKTHKFVTAAQISEWNAKQSAIADLSEIRSGAAAGATALQSGDNVSVLNNDAGYLVSSDIADKADKATSLSGYGISDAYTKTEIDGKLASGMHYKGTKASASALPSSGNETGDLWNVEDTGANYAWNGSAWDKLSENIDLSGLVPKTTTINGKTLNANITLTYTDVNALSASTSIPSDTSDLTNGAGFITSAALPSQLSDLTDDLGTSPVHTHSQYLTEHQDISGKQDKIDASHKLDADLIKDGTTNKVVTAAKISEWNAKQDAITDLATIRSEASAGAGAATTIASYGDIVTHNASEFLTEHQSLDGLVPNTRTVNGKTLNANITLTYTDVNALSANTSIPVVSDTYSSTSGNAMSGKAVYNAVKDKANTSALSDYELKSNVTSKGNATTPVYFDAEGVATAISYTIAKSVPSDAKFTDTTYTGSKGITLSGTDFQHSNSITAGTAGQSTSTSGSTLQVPYVTYDSEGHITGKGTHTHTVTGFLTQHQDISGKADLSELATVATSGDYDDLQNKPTIPTVPTNVSAFNNDAGYLTEHQSLAGYAKTSELSTVATSGDYTDLTNKPTIPTVPTNVSAFNNDANYITASDIPSEVSAFSNDAGYITTTALSTYQKSDTAVTHTKNTAVGNTITPVYIANNGTATALSYTIAKSVPSDAKFSDTTYTAGSGLSLSGTEFAHTNTIEAGTAGQSAASSGSTLQVPYVTYDANGHITGKGTHTHTVSGFVPTSRTVNGKSLSSNITLTYTDVNALSASTVIPSTYSDIGAASESHTHTYSDVGALSASTVIPVVTDTYSSTSSNGMSGKAVYSAVKDKADKATSLSGYGITDAYTKDEVDNKLTSAMVYKGTKASESALPTTGNKVGDVWNVTDTGHNYAWDGTAWDKLSGTVDLSGYVPTSRKVAGKALTADITLSASDVGALPSSTTIPVVTDTYSSTSSNAMSGKAVYSAVSGKQDSDTAVTHTKNTAAGNTITPVYIASNGTATALSYTIAKSVPSDAVFTDTTYTASSGITLSGTEFKHTNAVTSGTAGTSTATSGSTLAIPYVTYDANGHITAKGNRTHTVTGFLTSADITGKANLSELATVATSGDYTDLTNTPTIPTVPTNVSDFTNDAGYLTSSDISGKQNADTAVTHTKDTAAGNTITPVYIASNGAATALSYTIAKSVPSDALFTDTTYSAGTDLSLSGTTFNHKASGVTAGTAGTSTASSGSTLTVPYVTYNAQGHVTAAGTHTHTVSGFVPTSRTVNGKTLNADITLTYTDVTAASASHTHSYTYSDVGAASESHTHGGADVTVLTGYAIASASASVSASDDLLTALGKLEYKANQAATGTVTVGMLAG